MSESAWSDAELRRLAKRPVALPLEASERDHAMLQRRFGRLLIGFVLAIFVALVVLFAWLGKLPGFLDRETLELLPPGMELKLAAVLVVLPLLAGLLVWLLVHGRFRRRPDEADHPWRFQATREGLTVATAGGRSFGGPWAQWAYVGYSYMRLKGSHLVTGLTVSHGGSELRIEFSRFHARMAADLAAAVLQGLESAGHTDR